MSPKRLINTGKEPKNPQKLLVKYLCVEETPQLFTLTVGKKEVEARQKWGLTLQAMF